MHRDAFVLTLRTLIAGWHARQNNILTYTFSAIGKNEIDELTSMIVKAKVFIHNEFGEDT